MCRDRREKGTSLSIENRTICFDTQLHIEAYFLQGIVQDFPNHFHEEYVIGFLESGLRQLRCNNREYLVQAGDLLVFNPRDTHACTQVSEVPLDWRCLNIRPEVMSQMAGEITGREYLPYFQPNVLLQSEHTAVLCELHDRIAQGDASFRKEELFFFLMEQLIHTYAEPSISPEEQAFDGAIEAVCAYLEEHYAETIALNELAAIANRSKYHLLRTFTRQKGISPYRYLETVRIGKAKKLLEEGTSPAEAAFRTGFSDQSHFTNFFKTLIGLTPRQYGNIFLKGNIKDEGN